MIVTLRSIDMRTRWNSHLLLGDLIEFVRALREKGLEGKWSECEDG
jgi:hypothetical protein